MHGKKKHQIRKILFRKANTVYLRTSSKPLKYNL